MLNFLIYNNRYRMLHYKYKEEIQTTTISNGETSPFTRFRVRRKSTFKLLTFFWISTFKLLT